MFTAKTLECKTNFEILEIVGTRWRRMTLFISFIFQTTWYNEHIVHLSHDWFRVRDLYWVLVKISYQKHYSSLHVLLLLTNYFYLLIISRPIIDRSWNVHLQVKNRRNFCSLWPPQSSERNSSSPCIPWWIPEPWNTPQKGVPKSVNLGLVRGIGEIGEIITTKG